MISEGFSKLMYRGEEVVSLEDPITSRTMVSRKRQPNPNKIMLDMRYKVNKEAK